MASAQSHVPAPHTVPDHGLGRPRSMHRGAARRPFSPAVARIAANVATAGFLLVALLQVLLALGVVPVTMAWGGTQPVLTAPLQIASLAAAVVLCLAAYVARRWARPHPSRPMYALAWMLAVLLAVNTAGNFASRSAGEALLFGPLSLVLALSCLVVGASRHPDHADATCAAPPGAAEEVAG